MSELEQIQEERSIPSFEEFIPNSSALMEYVYRIAVDEGQTSCMRDEYEKDFGINYENPKRCYVGEAFGFSDAWKECIGCLSLGFWVLCRVTRGYDSWLDYKKELYDHMKEVHWQK